MRVLVLVIASRGKAYDGMRRAWDVHLRAAPACVDVRFLYGARDDGAGDDGAGDDGLVGNVEYDIPECIVPGALDKTVRFLSETDVSGYAYVVRTNLSSWFHWDRLLAWLRERPRAGFAAGYSPDRSHLSGCNLTLSRDLAAGLACAPLDRGLVDDLAWSPWIFSEAAVVECVPRLDLVYGDYDVELHGNVDAAWHVRLKHTDRDLDVALMDFLAREYDPDQSVSAHAVAALRAVTR